MCVCPVRRTFSGDEEEERNKGSIETGMYSMRPAAETTSAGSADIVKGATSPGVNGSRPVHPRHRHPWKGPALFHHRSDRFVHEHYPTSTWLSRICPDGSDAARRSPSLHRAVLPEPRCSHSPLTSFRVLFQATFVLAAGDAARRASPSLWHFR